MTDNPKYGDDLQFDRAVSTDGAQDPRLDAIVCAACATNVRTWYYDINGASHCARCKQNVQMGSGPVRAWGLTLKAVAYGLCAAIIGAIIYYAVIAITEFEIGLIALLIGWMVGLAIRKGANGRGGRRLQVAGAVLVYVAVAMAYLPLAIKGAVESGGITEQTPSADSIAAIGTRPSDPALVSDSGAAAVLTDPAEAEGSPIMALALLLGFTLALPALAVVGTLPSGLISALIIGIGMRQAWTMTHASVVTINGPYRVGGGLAEADSAGGAAASAA